MDLHLAKQPKTVPLLLVEDDPDYARLVRDMLAEAWNTEFEVRHASCLEDARRALLDFSPGCILVDLTLPDARWLEAPCELLALAPNVPVVILSGLDDESLAMRAVHEGAQDYLVKGHANSHSLGRAIIYAIERMQAEAESAKDATYDSLTGLPNRNLFIQRLEQARLRHAGQLASVAVLSVHLENLELINDSLGRPAGKQLLQAVSVGCGRPSPSSGSSRALAPASSGSCARTSRAGRTGGGSSNACARASKCRSSSRPVPFSSRLGSASPSAGLTAMTIPRC